MHLKKELRESPKVLSLLNDCFQSGECIKFCIQKFCCLLRPVLRDPAPSQQKALRGMQIRFHLANLPPQCNPLVSPQSAHMHKGTRQAPGFPFLYGCGAHKLIKFIVDTNLCEILFCTFRIRCCCNGSLDVL